VQRQVHAPVQEAVVQRGRVFRGAGQDDEVRAFAAVERRFGRQHGVVARRSRQRSREEAPAARPLGGERAEAGAPQSTLGARAHRGDLAAHQPDPQRLDRLLRPEHREEPQPHSRRAGVGVRFPCVRVHGGREAVGLK
jgi:hypothetical protein